MNGIMTQNTGRYHGWFSIIRCVFLVATFINGLTAMKTSSNSPSNTSTNPRQPRQLRGYLQDRRGFEVVFRLGFVSVACGFLTIILLQKASFGFGLLVLGAVVLKCVREMCLPPPNNIWKFLLDSSKNKKRKAPVLVCLGDSLTHGKISANWLQPILPMLAKRIKYHGTICNKSLFQLPLYVVNAGQNSLVSTICAQERVQPVLECQPDYVVVMIGTNDLLCMYSRHMANYYTWSWELDDVATNKELMQRNLKEILEALVSGKTQQTGDATIQVAICTLPPMGEDLTHPANRLSSESASQTGQFQHSQTGSRPQ
jgi:lysophospholipase L1-like esterase